MSTNDCNRDDQPALPPAPGSELQQRLSNQLKSATLPVPLTLVAAIDALLNHIRGSRTCHLWNMVAYDCQVDKKWADLIAEGLKRIPNAGAVPRRGSDVGTSPLLAVSESGDK